MHAMQNNFSSKVRYPMGNGLFGSKSFFNGRFYYKKPATDMFSGIFEFYLIAVLTGAYTGGTIGAVDGFSKGCKIAKNPMDATICVPTSTVQQALLGAKIGLLLTATFPFKLGKSLYR